MAGKHSWSMLLCREAADSSEWPVSFPASCEENETEGDTSFSIGLGLQRLMKVRLDVTTNQCHRQLPNRKWREIKVAQAAESGLLCVRLDEFGQHKGYIDKHGYGPARNHCKYRIGPPTGKPVEPVTPAVEDAEGDEMDRNVVHGEENSHRCVRGRPQCGATLTATAKDTRCSTQ